MIIYVLRHGATTASFADAKRELSELGVSEVEKVVTLRQEDLASVQRMHASPLLRIRQTLDIASGILGFNGEVIEEQNLATGSRLKEIVDFVEGLDFDSGDILVSSHQSCTSILVLWLSGEDILIPNGSLLAIEIDRPERGAGTILWQQSQNSTEIKRTKFFADEV